ncbi:MAG: MBOAT family protein [Deltaproteobacteria bacterium]|nr:MBOAT family protein [Deltaproteobacteria bacterium]
MLFNSLTFLVFLAAVLALHRLPLAWRTKKLNLLLASYLFYAAWNPPFIVLLWISTVTDWLVGRRLAREARPRRRRLLLLVSLGVNLGLLGYFKYAGFVLDNFVWLVNRLGVDYHPAAPDIILPLGISFYTFQTLSYTISIYRGDLRPARHFLDFALFVTFFPQLVAGPIVRAGDFITQLAAPKQADGRQLGWGMALLGLGLFEKVVLSDRLQAPIADRVFAMPALAGRIDAWIGTLAFTGQIFFDFAGYSVCAIGVALCLGFELPWNFRCPYAARGFSDFWRRWHITLSSWLRDYLYISLGGNRRGSLRTYANLALTMLLGGLWHGASWNFVIWGGLHGVYLIAERLLRGLVGEARIFQGRGFVVAAGLLTFLVVSVTWVFFRAEDLAGATALLGAMVGGGPGHRLHSDQVWTVLSILGLTLVAQGALRDRDLEALFLGLPLWLRGPILAFPILCLIFVDGDDRAFIYFQF